MDPKILKELQMEKNNDFDNPKYSELLFKYYYTEHILRKPGRMARINQSLFHINPNVYVFMQGHSEFGITGNASH
jgi:proline iminopeptidase